MATIINADTSNGLKLTSDTSGILELQSGGVTQLTINSNGISAGVSGRNKIINGNMQIAQRGTTGTAGAGGSYLASDRWKAWDASDAVVTVSQETDGPTGQFTKCLKYNVTTADASITAGQFGMVRQMIEGYNIIDLGFGTASAQSVTISFWVKSSLTGSHGAALNNGNEDRSYPFAYTISVANTWEYKTVTIPGDTSGTWDTDNTAGMIITFGMGTGSTYEGTADAWQAGNKFQPTSTVANIGTISNWNVTGVQLEAGTISTDFENLPYTTQLQLCQRYLPAFSGISNWFGFGIIINTSRLFSTATYKVPTRVAPTGLVISSASHFQCGDMIATSNLASAISISSSGTDSALLDVTSSVANLTAARPGVVVPTSASALIYFTGCEL
tara:strand:- start:186 stop:1346 length:1161 start_codon:yes stop_codon:yes gene_type:complete